MRPVSVASSHGRWRLTHRCERCGLERANFARAEEADAVIRLMRELGNPSRT